MDKKHLGYLSGLLRTMVIGWTLPFASVMAFAAGEAVTLSPASASISPNAAISLTATVTGTPNTAVTWTVDGIANGNATVGTITQQASTPVVRQNYYTASSKIRTGITVVAGDLVCVGWVVGNSPGGANTACSDSSGNAYSEVGGTGSNGYSYSAAAGAMVYQFYTIASVSNASLTVTISSANTNSLGIFVTVVQGMSSSQATVLDSYANAADSASVSSHTTGTVTTTSPGDFLVSVWGNGQVNGTLTEGSTGFTIASTTTAGAMAACYRIAGAAGNYGETVTSSAAMIELNVLAAFKAAVGRTVTYTAPTTGGNHMIVATSIANTSQSASCPMTVTGAVPPPVATSLTATPPTPLYGGTFTLTPTYSGGTSTINNGVVCPASGVATTPIIANWSGARAYTLTVTNSVGATATISVPVTPQTVIMSPVTPASPSIPAGGTQTFSASVTGAANLTINWSVDGILGGNASVGTISTAGLYFAPTTAGPHTITATAAANSNVIQTTTVTVNAVISSVYLNDFSLSAGTSASVVFSTTPSGAPATVFNWSTSAGNATSPGTIGGDSANGTISATGLYTPPASPLVGANVYRVWAVAKADGTVKDFCYVTIPASTYPGFGYAATGGAGLATVHVTNLNDSGAGSFRAAIGSDRTIVFDVGGIIDIPASSSDITGSGISNLTIDGSTAPSPGITFVNRGINFAYSNNIIVKYIRHRGGFNVGAESGGCLTFHPSCFNVVVDHCSFSGFQDEAIDFWDDNHDVTIQNCIVGAGMAGTGHNFECLISERPYNITVYRNLFHRGQYRNPAIGWADNDSPYYPSTSSVLNAEVVNNVTYGYELYGITIYWGAKANVLGNWLWSSIPDNNTPSRAVNIDSAPDSFAYASGNYLKGGSTPTGNVGSPFSVPAAAQIAATDAATAAVYVKANAGCRVGGLDAIDQAILDDLNL